MHMKVSSAKLQPCFLGWDELKVFRLAVPFPAHWSLKKISYENLGNRQTFFYSKMEWKCRLQNVDNFVRAFVCANLLSHRRRLTLRHIQQKIPQDIFSTLSPAEYDHHLPDGISWNKNIAFCRVESFSSYKHIGISRAVASIDINSMGIRLPGKPFKLAVNYIHRVVASIWSIYVWGSICSQHTLHPQHMYCTLFLWYTWRVIIKYSYNA